MERGIFEVPPGHRHVVAVRHVRLHRDSRRYTLWFLTEDVSVAEGCVLDTHSRKGFEAQVKPLSVELEPAQSQQTVITVPNAVLREARKEIQ